MHVGARKIAFGGLLLAVTEICMLLGSVIETSTLFLLAAASYFIGVFIRETNRLSGVAFYLAGVLLGFLLTPNKFYVASYGAMGLYILVVELTWPLFGRLEGEKRRLRLFWLTKFLAFQGIYFGALLAFGSLILTVELTTPLAVALVVGGEVGWFVYDRAYAYFQRQVWGRIRGRIFRLS